MELRVLGPLEIVTDARGGEPTTVPVAARKLRELLLLLLLAPDRAVDADLLADELWDSAPPRSAASVLRTYAGQVRRLLPPGAALEHAASSYRLHVAPERVDACRFAHLVAEGAAALPGEPEGALDLLRAALALWRGRPYDEVADRTCALPAVARLQDLRWQALEAEGEALLALGRHRELVPELELRVAQAPLREALQAQLVLALYRSGRQSEALAAYDAVRRTLAGELGLEPSQELQRLQQQVLRHDPELLAAAPPVAPRPGARAVDLGALDTRGAAPPPAPPRAAGAPGAPRRRLPFPVTVFVGREGDVDDLVELLRTRRLVTLTGPGGAGKSRLALEVGHRLDGAEGGPADGVWLAELAGATTGHDVQRAVAAALGLGRDASGGLAELAEQVADLDVLLVLDDCEHVATAAAPVVAGLLTSGPRVRVLATSRLPLGLAGEVLWHVPPLGVPPPGVASLEELVAFDAGALLADRAGLVRPRAALRADEVAGAAAVCRRLDGLPLALELAAARLRTLSVPGLATALDAGLELSSRDPTVPARQRSLRALLDWSVGLLTPSQRLLLARLAVFPAPPTQAALVAVAAGPDLAADDVGVLLGDLVEHSLVTVLPSGGQPRFGLLGVVREHALRLLGPAEAARLGARLAALHTGSAAALHTGSAGALRTVGAPAPPSSSPTRGAAGAHGPGGHDDDSPHPVRARPATAGRPGCAGGGRGGGPRRDDGDRQ